MAGIIEVKDQGVLRIYDADNSNYVDIVVPSTVSSNRTITIPDATFTIPTTDTVFSTSTITGQSAETSVADDDLVVISDTSASGALKKMTKANFVGSTGKINQIVQTVKSDTFTSTSTTFADVTGMSVAITPSATSSKVLVMATLNCGNDTDDRWSAYRLVRGSTALSIGDDDGSRTRGTVGHVRQTATGAQNLVENMSVIYLDSPSTTSATTYKLSCKVQSGGAVLTFNRPGNNPNADYIVRTASSITAIEVLA